MSGSTTGLSVSDVIAVSVSLTPSGALPRNFGATMIIGGSGVIDITQRFRSYSTVGGILADFGSSAPEYLAAVDFFAQSPTPSFVYVGAWAQNATPGVLRGGTLSATQQLLANFTAISTGSTKIIVAGTTTTLSALNLSSATNLASVATLIQSALVTAGLACTFVWNSVYSRFVLTTTATGAAETMTYFAPTGSGTDISTLIGGTAASGAVAVSGVVAESPLTALSSLAALSNDWYMAGFAGTVVTDVQHVANAAFIEALTPVRVYGVTTQETGALVAATNTDLASLLLQGAYTRTVIQYSTYDPNAIFSFFGRNATINYSSGSNVAITMKFKTEPGVTAEQLTEAQAASLIAKNCNVFVTYQNGVAIVQQGVMSSGLYFDVRQGVDWLQNQIQTDCFNALFTSSTKVPQTDAGVGLLVSTIANTCAQGVTNGLIAPGVWNATGFGSLLTGQILTKGYYIYAQTINSQSEAVRVTRAAPAIQVAIKLGGAIHSANVAVSVNQ